MLPVCRPNRGSYVVGYAGKTLTKKVFRLASVPFDAVDGLKNLNDTLKYPTTVPWDEGDPDHGIPPEFMTTAPQVQIQKPNGTYAYYYRLTDAWFGVDGDGNDIYDEGWADDNGTAATKALFEEDMTELDGENVPGQAIWFKDPLAEEDVNFQTAGGVPTKAVDITVPQVFRLRAATFPVPFQVNDAKQVVYSDMPTVPWDEGDPDHGIPPEFMTTAPQIQIQKPNGTYQYLYYLSDAWYGTDESDDDIYDFGWADDNGTAVTPENFAAGNTEIDGICPINGGFWAKGVSTTFKMKMFAPSL